MNKPGMGPGARGNLPGGPREEYPYPHGGAPRAASPQAAGPSRQQYGQPPAQGHPAMDNYGQPARLPPRWVEVGARPIHQLTL